MKIFIFVLSLVGFALPVQAGEILRPTVDSDFTWASTDCNKPIRKPHSEEFSKQDSLMDYATQIELYIDCIQREAQADFQRAQEDMQTALQRDLDAEVATLNEMMMQAAKANY